MPVNLFDANFYRTANADLTILSEAQALAHFQTHGLNEGRAFSPFVNLNFYRSVNADLVSLDNQQAYNHLQVNGVREGRRFSPLVDLNFYRAFYRDLAGLNNEQAFEHLQNGGVREGRSFSQFADLNFYRAFYSDLTGLNNTRALQHLEIRGLGQGRIFSQFFDINHYLAHNPDLESAGLRGNQLLEHFEIAGLGEGRSFSLAFDVNYYRNAYFDLTASGLSNQQLYEHFQLSGLREGRASSPDFNVSYYLANNADLRALNFNNAQAYDHFVLSGQREGRPGSPHSQPEGEIRGTNWNDIDGNSLQGTSEPGLAGWTIYLDQNQNGQFDLGEVSTATDTNGNYTFTGLAAGTYTVAAVLQPGWENSSGTRAVNLSADQSVTGVNFGNRANLLSINLTPQASGFTNPLHITNAGDGSDRLFVVEQGGRIRIFQNGTLLTTPFLDISSRISSGGERGLLSVAFPPEYASKGYFYVYYTNTSGDTVVARYRLTDNPNIANPDSEQIILTIDQPFANHNGGQLAFGSDGYLYIGTGDGGSSGDPQNNAQNPNSLLGKILRIDVESGAATYTIPSSNPFLTQNDPGNVYRDEIWALGLRNPWRFSFDRQTGDLYIADVGQNLYEEVDFQAASSSGGENYGWNIMEGAHRYNNNPGDLTGLVLPVVEYDHSQGASVTGGMVYRASLEQRLQGVYFYGDFVSGRIWGLRRDGSGWENALLIDTPYNISSFGEDEAGNLYVADFIGGGIYKILG